MEIKIGQIADEKGITMYALHKATGISQGLLSDYKKGKKVPRADNLCAIADYLNCSIDYLVGRTDVDYWPQVEKTQE